MGRAVKASKCKSPTTAVSRQPTKRPFEIIDATAPTNSTCLYPTNGAFTAKGRIKDKDGGSTDYMVQVVVQTPQEAAQNLIDQVLALNKPQGNGLIGKLNATRLASGFYLYRLEAEGFAQTKKLLLMK